MNSRIRVRAVNNFVAPSIDLHVIREDFTRRPVLVEALVLWLDNSCDFRPVPEGILPPNAAIRLQPDDAQQLMDDLYRMGIRPVDGKGSVGQLEAVQAHLEDMRQAYAIVLAGAR